MPGTSNITDHCVHHWVLGSTSRGLIPAQCKKWARNERMATTMRRAGGLVPAAIVQRLNGVISPWVSESQECIRAPTLISFVVSCGTELHGLCNSINQGEVVVPFRDRREHNGTREDSNMFPRIEPLTVSLRRGTVGRQPNDPLYVAWSHLVNARAVPYLSTEPGRWVREFNSSARAALEAFNLHTEEADSLDSWLSTRASAESQGAMVVRQRGDHAKLRGRLEGLVAMTCRPQTNILGQVVLANEDAALIQLFLGLHHRRLGNLLREAGVMLEEEAIPVSARGIA